MTISLLTNCHCRRLSPRRSFQRALIGRSEVDVQGSQFNVILNFSFPCLMTLPPTSPFAMKRPRMKSCMSYDEGHLGVQTRRVWRISTDIVKRCCSNIFRLNEGLKSSPNGKPINYEQGRMSHWPLLQRWNEHAVNAPCNDNLYFV